MFQGIDAQQGVAQGSSFSPILFSVFINGLLKEVEQAGLGVEQVMAVLLEACYLQMTLSVLAIQRKNYKGLSMWRMPIVVNGG